MAEKIRLDTKYDLKGEYNPSDSEEEYSENEKRLLNKVRKKNQDDSESGEEVYGFSDSGSEKDDIELAESDVEGQEGSGDDLPDTRAWGQKKRSFYSTDYVDEDYGGFGKDEEAATLEEKEARLLQSRLTENLEDEDFSLEFFTSKKTDIVSKENESEILVKSDLSQMSKRQKIQLLEKESPEFSGLVEDFQEKLGIAKDSLLPILNLAKNKKIPDCPALHFIKTKYDLILNYCTNISFYLLLKTKKLSIQNHPVIKRLYQYRQMLNQLEGSFESNIKPQVDKILCALKNNEKITIVSNKTIVNKKRKMKNGSIPAKKLKLLNNISKEKERKNTADLKLSNEVSEQNTDSDEENNDGIEDTINNLEEETAQTNQVIDGDGEKRAITYQMAKNKGLTPHRKKEQRNPRVKHRNKYRKAKIRRKGAVREVRTEVNRYAGEISGIKANVKKSIKIR